MTIHIPARNHRQQPDDSLPMPTDQFIADLLDRPFGKAKPYWTPEFEPLPPSGCMSAGGISRLRKPWMTQEARDRMVDEWLAENDKWVPDDVQEYRPAIKPDRVDVDRMVEEWLAEYGDTE